MGPTGATRVAAHQNHVVANRTGHRDSISRLIEESATTLGEGSHTRELIALGQRLGYIEIRPVALVNKRRRQGRCTLGHTNLVGFELPKVHRLVGQRQRHTRLE